MWRWTRRTLIGLSGLVVAASLTGVSADWGFVQPEVAAFTRVCSYDRAGMGYSDPGPSPRTTRRIAHELAHLLDRTVVVITAGRDADPAWRSLQRDQVGLSERGCHVVAQQSGHAIALGQPQAIVDSIRAIVDVAKGRKDTALCG